MYLDDSFVHEWAEKSGHVFLILSESSGTEEDYTELHRLLEDILTYRRDVAEMKEKEKDARRLKEEQDKKMGEEMRLAAIQGMNS